MDRDGVARPPFRAGACQESPAPRVERPCARRTQFRMMRGSHRPEGSHQSESHFRNRVDRSPSRTQEITHVVDGQDKSESDLPVPHAHPQARASTSGSSSCSSGDNVRGSSRNASVAHDADHRRLAGARGRLQLERRARLGTRTSTTQPGSSRSGSAPPPTSPSPRATCAASPGIAASSACREVLGARHQLALADSQHGQRRNVVRGALGLGQQRQRGLERRERQLVEPQRARQRVRPHATRSCAACPRSVRPASRPSSLSPENVTTSTPAARLSATVGSCASPRRGEIHERAAAEVFDQRHASCASPAPRGRRASGRVVKPSIRKLLRCTRSTAAAPPFSSARS